MEIYILIVLFVFTVVAFIRFVAGQCSADFIVECVFFVGGIIAIIFQFGAVL